MVGSRDVSSILSEASITSSLGLHVYLGLKYKKATLAIARTKREDFFDKALIKDCFWEIIMRDVNILSLKFNQCDFSIKSSYS